MEEFVLGKKIKVIFVV